MSHPEQEGRRPLPEGPSTQQFQGVGQEPDGLQAGQDADVVLGGQATEHHRYRAHRHS